MTDDLNLSPFQPFDQMDFSDSQCFLCGQALEQANSIEHIFPKWLLSHFNLWDQMVSLPNQTQIPYRYLTIPCCTTCNNEHLARLEHAVGSAFRMGPGHVAAIDKTILYQWTGKIFYGLLYRELSLALDRSRPELGTITSPELIGDYRTLHNFLQSIRTPVQFEDFFPGSVFALEIETIPGVGNFDYSDNFVGMTFCMRIGNVGLITCLKDDELIHNSLSDLYQALDGVRLHPIQFDELCAIVFYKAYSMNRSGSYAFIAQPRQKSSVYRVPGFSLVPVFGEWDNRVFARFLEAFWAKWGINYDEIYFPPDTIRSYLSDYL
jgi:hypothetical protein